MNDFESQPTIFSATSSLSTLNISTTSPGYVLTKDIIIWGINERKYSINIPSVSLLIISIVMGVFGNSAAIYIFGVKTKRNNTNIFTAWLSTYELLTSFLNIFEVYDKRFPMYSGAIPNLCKLVRFLSAFTNSASAFLLLCVAFDRYFMVCKPLERKSPKARKQAIIAAFVVPLVCVWPMGIFHGPEIRPTPYEGIYGVDCADDDRYSKSVVRKIFYFFLMLTIITSIVILIVLYVLIFYAITKWKNSVIGESGKRKEQKLAKISVTGLNETTRGKETSKKLVPECREGAVDATTGHKSTRGISETVCKNTSDKRQAEHHSVKNTEDKDTESEIPNISSSFHRNKLILCNISLQRDADDSIRAMEEGSIDNRISEAQTFDGLGNACTETVNSNRNNMKDSGRKERQTCIQTKERTGRQRKTNMTTLMLFSVSLLYIVSFLPTVVTEALNSMGAVYETDLPRSTKQVIVIANMSHFLNGSLNPIIYFVFNKDFRREVIGIFTR